MLSSWQFNGVLDTSCSPSWDSVSPRFTYSYIDSSLPTCLTNALMLANLEADAAPETTEASCVCSANIGLGLAASRPLLELGLSHLDHGRAFPSQRRSGGEPQLRKDFPGSRVSAVSRRSLVPVLKSSKTPGASRTPALSIAGFDAAYLGALKATHPVLLQSDDHKAYSMMRANVNPKLLLVFFVAKLAKLVSPSDALINVSSSGTNKGPGLGHGSFINGRAIKP
ncbi:hypothetical protein LX36DRAFT_752340 [Colletotrichum falcatum]|nr:hypothetical protein LX36DRAFT_752340 [Colletotrichum falcatum]